MPKLARQIPRVAIVLSRPCADHLKVLRGILRFTQLHSPWSMEVRMGRNGEPKGFNPDQWDFDGLIASRMTRELAELASRHHTLTVTLGNAWMQGKAIAHIDCNNAPIARMAAEYLVGRGFTEFAFVGERSGLRWSVERESVFKQVLAEKGFDCRIYPGGGAQDDSGNLREWLKTLPRHTAVFASHDIRARQVMDASKEAGLEMPCDIALLSVDNDELMCETASPTLSSISTSTEKAGYDAAEMLDRAMSSEWRPKDTAKVWYTGIEVVARRSTANEFVCDELVRRCLELIEANSGRRFNVADLVSHLDVSRRTLEKHFLAVTGRSLNDDITAARLRRAQALLSRTSMTQAQIAATCGFADASHMNVVFRRRLGALPSSFRIR